MSAGQKWVGQALERSEDRTLMTRGGHFIDDLSLPGVAHAAYVRSPHARATEDEVRAFFAPYEEWGGLAAMHAGRAVRGREDVYTPSPGRNSFVRARAASGGVRTSRLAAIQFP